MTTRRQMLEMAAVGAALAGALPEAVQAAQSAKPAAATVPPGTPWVRRMFHMYTDASGQSVIRELDVPAPGSAASQWLLRRPAERVTAGAMAPGYMMDFHVANQPNLLIPLFGTLVVKLKDGKEWVFRHGDILFAEDCTGGGHMSGAGPEGCFSISVQIPKTEHCLDPAKTPADVLAGRGRPAV